MPDFSIAPDGYVSEEPIHSASQEVSARWPQFDAKSNELNMLLLRCFNMVRNSASDAVEAQGYPLSRASTVSRLYLAGQRGLTIGEIATLQDMTHANASKLVDGLVKDKLATKAANPEDARSMYATLTERGVEEAKRIGPVLYGAIESAWGGLNQKEQRVLIHLLSKLRMISMASEGDIESWLDVSRE